MIVVGEKYLSFASESLGEGRTGVSVVRRNGEEGAGWNDDSLLGRDPY